MKILFCGYGGAHIRTQIPVIHKLLADGDLDLEVLALTTATAALQQEGIPHIGYRDLLPHVDARAAGYGEQLAADFPPSPVVSREETVAYLGINYLELVNRHGEAGAASLYGEQGRAVFQPDGIMQDVLQQRRVDMVVASNAPRTERAAIKAAQALGLSNLVIGDAFLVGEVDWLSTEENVGQIAVFADYVKRQLTDRGRDADTVHVTGNPALDRLAAPETRRLGEDLRAQLGWQDRKVLSWALPLVKPGDSRVAPVEQTLDMLTGYTRRDPDLRILVRPHPNSGVMFDDLPDAFRFHEAHRPVDEAIFCCDVLLTEFSMVGLEAALAGKPVITIASGAIVPYAELGIAEDMSSVANLVETLERAFSGGIHPDTGKLGAATDGGATDRVCQLVRHLLHTGGKADR